MSNRQSAKYVAEARRRSSLISSLSSGPTHETTTLIQRLSDVEGGSGAYGSTSVAGNRTRSDSLEYSSLWEDEFWGMLWLALPVTTTYLLEMLPGIAATIIVGNLQDERNAEYLDATAMGVMFANITGLSIGLGLCTAMDTLCSQAFGANEPKKMGTYAQTGFFVLLFCTAFAAVMFLNATEILIALGQPEEVSQLAGTFVRYMFPGIPFIYGYELVRKVLQAQNIANPMVMTSVLANIINICVGYGLVYYTEFSYLGAAIALSCNYISLLVFVVPYLAWSGVTEVFWDGLHLQEAILGVPEFLSFGIPGMLQMIFEWWAFEVLGLICGLFPNAVVAIGANAIVMNLTSLTYMIYLGIAVAGNVRIGNALGANEPLRASLAAKLTLRMSVSSSVLNTVFLFVFSSSLPNLFTRDTDVAKLATTLFTVVALYQIPDAVTCSVMGIFRGMGWQKIGAYLNFAVYYIVGLPTGCVLAFWLGWNVVGLWLGMIVGVLSIAVCGTYMIFRCDWKALADSVGSRIA